MSAQFPSRQASRPSRYASRIIALHHQLMVLQRCQRSKRIRKTLIHACGSGYLDGCACVVKPETVIEWHRQGFRWYNVLNKSAETQNAVTGLLPKRIRKRAEKSGKLGTQTVESNEINMMEKTLNQ